MDAAEVVVKVKFGKTIVIHGEDWQIRIFASASQPRHPERTYFVLTESPYDGHALEMMTEAEIDARLAAVSKGSVITTPASLEDVLRMGNQDRTMGEYVFPPLTPYTMKDI